MCARILLHGFSSAWVIDSEKLSDFFVHVRIEAYSVRIGRKDCVIPEYVKSPMDQRSENGVSSDILAQMS